MRGTGLCPGREPFTESRVNSKLIPTLSAKHKVGCLATLTGTQHTLYRAANQTGPTKDIVLEAAQRGASVELDSTAQKMGGRSHWGVVGVGRDLVTAFVHCAQSRMHL